MKSNMKRRAFLKTNAIITTGVMAGMPAFAQKKEDKEKDKPAKGKKKVIIIGAGFAGLAAAYRLHKNNVDFVILESDKRFGGRVFSHEIEKGSVIELGAEWVGESHTRIIELCKEFNLKLNNNQFHSDLIYKNERFEKNKWNFSLAWREKYEQLLEDYHNMSDAELIALDKIDWWRYLSNNGCEGNDLKIMELIDSTDFGESIRHVSAFAALAEYAESSEYNEMDMKIEGGNTMLAQKIVERIGAEKVLLNHKVTKVEQTGNKVRVYCDNNTFFDGDNVICTAPTFAVNKITWSPAMPKKKQAALNQLQYCRINKHAVLFNKRFWEREDFDLVTDETHHYFYHATKNQPGKSGVLIGYSIGEKAAVVGQQNESKNAKMLQDSLAPHYGNVQNHIKKQVNYYWGDDERSMGAYAMYGIGQWFGLMPILQEPFLNTYFAGEHLAEWQGFMEGAVNTGESAADEIIGKK